MLVLALDTATPQVSVAVVDLDAAGTRVVAAVEQVADRQQGELLAAMVAQSIQQADVSTADIDAVVTGLGPGPFTGLRVGVMTAAALADALDVPAYGQCSLDAVAVAAAVASDGGDLLVITDALRKQVYWARYDRSGDRVEGPDLGYPADVADRFRQTVSRVVGPATTTYADAFAGMAAGPAYPIAACLVTCAAPRVLASAPADALEPMYLRRPDAQPPGPPKQVLPA